MKVADAGRKLKNEVKSIRLVRVNSLLHSREGVIYMTTHMHSDALGQDPPSSIPTQPSLNAHAANSFFTLSSRGRYTFATRNSFLACTLSPSSLKARAVR